MYSCFLPEEQIFKNSKRERLRDAYETQLRVRHIFLNSTHKHIKLIFFLQLLNLLMSGDVLIICFAVVLIYYI